MRFLLAVIFSFLFVIVPSSSAFAECKQFVQLWSAADVAREMGVTEQWVVSNHKINVWAKTSEKGKFPKVGSIRPGSRALLLSTSTKDFKIKSPLDGSIGWISHLQVNGMLMQDDKTFKPCP